MLAEGTLLGKYKIVRLLGTGGMADVYEAEDSMLGRRVALKVLPPEFGRDETAVARFEKEVRAAASLNHANIVTIFEVDRADDIHFCSMRLLRGGDLRARIDKGLSEADALAITREIAQAFVHAHASGFVHRDVKPENILFDDQGRAILTDFGIAKAIHSQSKMTATGVSIGTPRYISPEQARGQTVDGRADLYSLGAILYEMLTGKPPFEAEDSLAMIFKHVTEPVPRLPEPLARYQPLIDSLMAKEPERRPENAAALVAMLGALPQPRPSPPKPAPPAAAAVPAPEAPPKVATGDRAYAERLVQEEQRQRESEARRRAEIDAAAAAAMPSVALSEPPPPPRPATPAPAPAAEPAARARRSVLSAAAPPTAAAAGAGGSRTPIFGAVAAILLGGGMVAWWLASSEPGTAADTELAAAAEADTDDTPAVAATAVPATPAPTAKAAILATAAPTAAPVVTPPPAVDEAARRKAEADRKRKQQEAERKRREAPTAAPVLSKAELLAQERKRCKRHVSELFPGWDFTYADMAQYPGVKKLGDGRLHTPPLAMDYGAEQRYEIDRNGCIVAILQ